MQEDILATMKHWGANIPEKDFNFGINLLKKRFEGKITIEEFLKECTYFMLKCEFDNPKPLPTRPQVLIDYDKKRNEAKAFGRAYEVKDSFWQEFKIQNYLEQKGKVIQTNAGNRSWLKENLKRLEQYGDPVNTAKVKNRIQEFEDIET